MAVCFSSSVLGVSLPSFFFFYRVCHRFDWLPTLKTGTTLFFFAKFFFSKSQFLSSFLLPVPGALRRTLYRVLPSFPSHGLAAEPSDDVGLDEQVVYRVFTEFFFVLFLFGRTDSTATRPSLLFFAFLFFASHFFLCVNKINKMDGKNSKRQKPSTSR